MAHPASPATFDLLLIGDTREARALDAALQGLTGVAVTTLDPALADAALAKQGWGAVVDASHPFSRRAASGLPRGVPVLRLERPCWRPTDADRWISIGDEAEIGAHVASGDTVFLTTGRGALDRLPELQGVRLLCRVKGAPDVAFPRPDGRFVIGPGPFTVDGEIALMRRAGIDWLVTRNSGGSGSWPKVAAARALGLPVLMIRRPPRRDRGAVVESVAEALDWIAARAAGP